MTYTIEPGASAPEGATWIPNRDGTNFALFARNATRVEVCLFDEPRGPEVQRLDLPERVEHVWRGFVAGIKPGSGMGIGCTVFTSRGTTIASILPSC